MPVYNEDGFLRTDSVNDRCLHYVPRKNLPNLNRCVCCVYYDDQAQCCKNEKNQARCYRCGQTNSGQFPQTDQVHNSQRKQ